MSFRSAVKKLIPKGVFERIEPFGHLLEAAIVQLRYGFPARTLKVIGVTGTDGKTTTCMLIAAMLRNSGKKVAMLTTVSVDYGDGKGERPSPTHMTTASAGQLARMLKQIARNKPDWLVLETSSHALAQHRVLGVPYSIAVLTNITPEHLDYHKTFERYRAAKRELFVLTNRNKKGFKTGVINADDPNASVFADVIQNKVLYGLKQGDLKATNLKISARGSLFKVTSGQKSYNITCNLPGRFNVYNALAAISVGQIIGLSKKQIEMGIASLKSVPGRMLKVETKQPFDVIVDYAVTPAALENVLKTTRETTKGKVRIVFGATGDRDKSKRPTMGAVAAQLADVIYLTDDETYTENPAAIRAAVKKGIVRAGGESKMSEFNERAEAIQAAITDARPGDTVLITGIGHQTTRNMGGYEEPWSDVEQAEKALRSKKSIH